MNTENQNIDQHDELEQLRTQLAEFKSRLDRQEIVNDRLLRDALRGKVNGLRKYSNTIYILGAIGYLIIFAAFVVAKVTLIPVIVLGAMCLAEFIFCSWNLKQISGVSQMSVVDAQTAMAEYAKREKWLNIGEIIPVLALAAWAAIELRPDIDALPAILFVVIVTIVVCAILLGKQFKMVSDIQKSIATLRNESE